MISSTETVYPELVCYEVCQSRAERTKAAEASWPGISDTRARQPRFRKRHPLPGFLSSPIAQTQPQGVVHHSRTVRACWRECGQWAQFPQLLCGRGHRHTHRPSAPVRGDVRNLCLTLEGKTLTSRTLPRPAGWGGSGRGRFQPGFTSAPQELGHRVHYGGRFRCTERWRELTLLSRWHGGDLTFRGNVQVGVFGPSVNFFRYMASIPFWATFVFSHSLVSAPSQPHRLQPTWLPCPSPSVLLQRVQFMEIPTLQSYDHLFHGFQNHGKKEREVGDKAKTSQGWLRISLWAFECL